MARPKKEKEEKRIYRVVIRLNQQEHIKIEQAAKNSGVSSFKLIRDKLLKGRFPETKLSKIDLDTFLELKKIGVNLNQLTRLANGGILPNKLFPVVDKLLKQQETIISILFYDCQPEDH